MVGASHLGNTVGWGRRLEWADWVHVNNFVSRCPDSGFEVANNGRNMCFSIPFLSSELTYRNKRGAQEQPICHDGVLLMCVETVISKSIARTELVGDA